jgi:hypothetical protein|tara:strand:- start:265 stop:459 length:195 start_codon:yes stop_codon:yes gene_type:complete
MLSSLVKGFFDSCFSFARTLFRDAEIKKGAKMEVTVGALEKVNEAKKRVTKRSNYDLDDTLNKL